MSANVADFAGPLTVSQFKGGQSNPTYRLDTRARSYVLRRKPPGPLLPGAHAVEREARVMAALGTVGFPVPRIHGLCEDESVIGTAFFVMDMVEGRIIWDPTFPGLTPADRAAHFDAMNATIAQLHSVDPAAIGLADYGRPSNFVERQVARWSKQYEGDVEAGRVPAMDRLVDWLRANLPPDSGDARIVHGDFRCDNMIFAADEPRVAAVLDWELSTLGDPAADFVYHLMMYRMPAGMFTGLDGLDFAALGIPSEEDYIAAYCRRTGRESPAPYRLSDGVRDVPPGRHHAWHSRPAGARQCQFRPCRRDRRLDRTARRSGVETGRDAPAFDCRSTAQADPAHSPYSLSEVKHEPDNDSIIDRAGSEGASWWTSQ